MVPVRFAAKYLSIFRIRFVNGLQYRLAALAGVSTQFFWGFMEILLYRAFYRADPAAFPMEFSAMVSYIWLQQAFLTLYESWFFEWEIFDAITGGNVAYELCRPMNLYGFWFVRSAATRVAKAALRCLPVLVIAFLLPEPFGMTLPVSLPVFLLFLATMGMALLLTVSMTMIIYGLTFYTMSPLGLRTIFSSAAEFCSGALVPLPFLPDGVQKVLELLPFASVQNLPFRIYSGDIAGLDILWGVALQVFWTAALIAVGGLIFRNALKRAVVQGG